MLGSSPSRRSGVYISLPSQDMYVGVTARCMAKYTRCHAKECSLQEADDD